MSFFELAPCQSPTTIQDTGCLLQDIEYKIQDTTHIYKIVYTGQKTGQEYRIQIKYKGDKIVRTKKWKQEPNIGYQTNTNSYENYTSQFEVSVGMHPWVEYLVKL